MSAAERVSSSRIVAAVAATFALTIALCPHLPCVDLPQHAALAALLARLWSGEPAVVATYAQNAATHNGGLHWVVAALATLGLGPELGARLVLATYPPVLLGAVALGLRRAALPTWRALLVAPSLFGFAFGWGLANFCLGTALGWLAVALVLAQLRSPTAARAGGLALLSIALGVTHVMAMLLTAVVAAATGLEWLVRAGRVTVGRAGRLVAAGAPLALGCAYDVWVTRAHLALDGAAYTTPEGGATSVSVAHKIVAFPNSCAGLYGSYLDVAFAVLALAVIARMAWAARAAPSLSPPATPPSFVAPAAVLAVAYVALPDVFLNTHLIYQRLAQWVLVALLFAIPRAAPGAVTSGLRRAAMIVAVAAAVAAPVHLVAYQIELRGLDAALAAFPREASGVGVIERRRTSAIRLPTLTHVAALQVARGGLDDAFSFARWMSFPLVYGRDRVPVAPPMRSWEHDGSLYAPRSELARRYPWVLVRTAHRDESDEALLTRVFGDDARRVRLAARRGDWATIDTRDLEAP